MNSRLRLVLVLAITAVGLVPSSSRADEKSHRKAAEDLLLAANIESQLRSSIDQSIALQIKVNPQLAPMKDTFLRFFAKYMSWEALKEDVIAMYAEAFTEAELREITAFYRTPTGRKMIEKMPVLMAKGMQLGVSRVQANQAELRRMVEEEMLRKDQKKAGQDL
ncbi:MAG: DUF2059 domain-containing protein [Isosphaeraceae bacterium]